MEVLQLKCGVSVNKIVGGDSGKMIEVEHSTVTIKTDKDAEPEHVVNGVKKEEDSHGVRSSKRRRSSNHEPQEPARPVKRKRQHSDHENNSVVEKENNVIPNNCQPEKSSNLEILTVPIKKPQPNGLIEDKTVEIPTPTEEASSIENKSINHHSEDEDDEAGNDVVMVELDEEFVVEKIDQEGANSNSCQSQDESSSVDVIGAGKQQKPHRFVLTIAIVFWKTNMKPDIPFLDALCVDGRSSTTPTSRST